MKTNLQTALNKVREEFDEKFPFDLLKHVKDIHEYSIETGAIKQFIFSHFKNQILQAIRGDIQNLPRYGTVQEVGNQWAYKEEDVEALLDDAITHKPK